MFGLIGKMNAVPGQRDTLLAIMLECVENMPGCMSYVVAKDPSDENAVWITEVWDSRDSHAGSLQLPAVRQAIARAKPLIQSFAEHVTTEPVGGYGLASRKTE
jgi:quinol monooxygenase YgiN